MSARKIGSAGWLLLCDMLRRFEHCEGVANNLLLPVAGKDREADGEAAHFEDAMGQKFIVSGPRGLVGSREIKARAGRAFEFDEIDLFLDRVRLNAFKVLLNSFTHGPLIGRGASGTFFPCGGH
jgi:hypothetical protein